MQHRVSYFHSQEKRPVEVTLDLEAIEFLIATGWLDEEDLDDPEAVGYAVKDWLEFQATLLQ